METTTPTLDDLLAEVALCKHCRPLIPHEPRAVLQVHKSNRVMIIGQAPGRKVHASGRAWDDPSGDRLRDWLGLSRDEFYRSNLVGLLPMGFCYPGHGPGGDLPPIKECAPIWHARLLAHLDEVSLTLLFGTYSQSYYLGDSRKVTERARQWKDYLPRYIPLPHPSPRNNIWLRRHPWFEEEVVPEVQALVHEHLYR